jgi:hypothetical protein
VKGYLPEIIKAIKHNHGCKAVHVSTVPHIEESGGRIVWEGEVEVFKLIGHVEAKRCYAWGYPEGRGDVITVIKIPPVKSVKTAVKAAIGRYLKENQQEIADE